MSKKPTGVIALAGLAAAAGAGYYVYKKMQPRKDRIIPGKRRIACIGDSITFGAAVPLTRDRDAWPYILNGYFGEDYQVLNYGISGATAVSNGDLPYRKNDFFETARDARAELYLLMLGTNDTKPYNWNAEQYEADLSAMVEELQAADYPHGVTLLLPPKAFPGKNGVPAFDIVDETIRDEVCPIVRRIAEKYDTGLIDLYSFTEEHPEYFADGIHPNRIGNIEIAAYVYHVLTTAE